MVGPQLIECLKRKKSRFASTGVEVAIDIF